MTRSARPATQRGRGRLAFSRRRVGEEFFYGSSVLSLIFKYDRAPSVIEDAIRHCSRPKRKP
jgi:hypothetical protein